MASTRDTGIPFMRLEGCGNSFIVVDDLNASRTPWQSVSARILDPYIGLGTDGLMVVVPSRTAHFGVLMFNPDGSACGMCGNGIRCVARYLVLRGFVDRDCRSIDFEVAGREIRCSLHQEGRQVQVDMGVPVMEPQSVPLSRSLYGRNEPAVGIPLEVDGSRFSFTALSMGNPHCVIFVDDLDAIPLAELGPRIEQHALFPQRTNVEFVSCEKPDALRVRVWERGAGATRACGTGACASVVAGVLERRCFRACQVTLPGGTLAIDWQRESGRVVMTGPAQEVCAGTISPHLVKPQETEGKV